MIKNKIQPVIKIIAFISVSGLLFILLAANLWVSKNKYYNICTYKTPSAFLLPCYYLQNDIRKIIPETSKSIILSNKSTNIVSTEGEVNFTLDLSENDSLWMTLVPREPTDQSLLPFKYYSVSPKGKNNAWKETKLVHQGNKKYIFTFPAPSIPGLYYITLSQPFRESFILFTMDRVTDENMALRIANQSLLHLIEEYEMNVKNWNIESKTITSNSKSWIIELLVSYKSCGIDWSDNVCTNKTVKGKYFINKDNGFYKLDCSIFQIQGRLAFSPCYGALIGNISRNIYKGAPVFLRPVLNSVGKLIFSVVKLWP